MGIFFLSKQYTLDTDVHNEAQKQPILKYTYIQYLVQKDKTLVFSFVCPTRLKTEWQPVATAVMNSVRVK